MNNYTDMLYYPHHDPNEKHKRMSIYQRSAQFAPFNALTGFYDEIDETGRITSEKIILEQDEQEKINNNLKDINNKKMKITYFIKDKYKSGGKYIKEEVIIKKIDNIEKVIILSDKRKIKLDDIIKIE
ncbi:MAG: hypothetical protein IJ568_07475 [Bacilli bacterium]|nr:hypothetical protein [Bacilli bacterium]